jgi:predicted dehydrogenase
LHHAICKSFLEAGIDVICDKPLTTTLGEARDLMATVQRTGRLLGVTFNYTGYPMVREARALIEADALGAVRVVQVEFALGWLSSPIESESKQAAWRTDPAQAGASFIVGDLGTHCFHLSEFVTGRRVAALAADLQTMVPSRRLEDNAHILLRYDNGARGAMWVSAVAAGEQVGLRLRVYGEKGHIAWEQSDPDKLKFAVQGEASRTILRGQSGLSPAAKRATRIVAGLPEGYFEAFATLYRDYADILAARRAGEAPDPLALWAPMVEDGARGIAFVEAALSSNSEGGRWLEFHPQI